LGVVVHTLQGWENDCPIITQDSMGKSKTLSEKYLKSKKGCNMVQVVGTRA
jgi:hypothetical protein